MKRINSDLSHNYKSKSICKVLESKIEVVDEIEQAKIAFLQKLGLQPLNHINSICTKNVEKLKLFKCNGCESSFTNRVNLKKHLNTIHLRKLRPLRSSNVTADNIIAHKRHSIKVNHSKLLE